MTIARAYRWWADRYCPKAIWLRIGRRGSILMVAAFAWVLIGLQVATSGRTIDSGRAIFYEGWPISFRVALWIGTALTAAAAALCPHDRGQRIGWVAIALMPAERLMAHVVSLIQYVIPEYPPGTEDAWFVSLLWLCAIFVIVIVAGWNDDVPLERDPHEGA